MGREVRKVPPHWDHPDQERGSGLQPMFDQRFEDAAREWKEGFAAWEARTDENWREDRGEWWEWHGEPPDRAYYRPWRDEEATWFQVWETVTEGTPVTPPFATKEELVDHLVAKGDDWDQQRGNGGWNREAAERFVGAGWAPSMMVERTARGTTIHEPRDGPLPSVQ